MTAPHQRIELTDQQHQVLTGLMLGDGHLDRVSLHALLRVGRSQKDASYLRYESKIFRNLHTPLFKKQLIALTTGYDKRYNTTKLECYFRTARNPIFTEYHNKWYSLINGKYVKIVPNDIKLSAITVAHWVADDGYVFYNKLPYRFILSFATEGFQPQEVYFLAKLLYDRYNEKFDVHVGKNNQCTIEASDPACRVLFADIDEHFKMKRKRIWDKPESRFYSDQPPRQISTKDVFQWRQEKMAEIIGQQDHINLKELKDQLQYGKHTSLRVLKSILRVFIDQITVKNKIAHFNH